MFSLLIALLPNAQKISSKTPLKCLLRVHKQVKLAGAETDMTSFLLLLLSFTFVSSFHIYG
jgi:hypothetical protein